MGPAHGRLLGSLRVSALGLGCNNLGRGVDARQAAAGVASELGLRRFVCTQAQYRPLHRAPEADGVAQACTTLGLGLVPFHPLASGMLTGEQASGRLVRRWRLERCQGFVRESNFAMVDRLRAFAENHPQGLMELALGWLVAKAQAAVCTLTADGLAELDRITEG